MANISAAFNKAMLLSVDVDFKRNPSDMSLASSCEEHHVADSAYASPRPISLLVSEPVDAEEDEHELDFLLQSKDEWDFDLHKLDDLTGGRPLALLAASILSDRGLLDQLNIDRDALTAFLAAAEDAYSPDESAVSFHNSLHAADVLHGVHCLLNTPALTGYFTPLEIFAALIAAAVHDVDHPGRSNNFLIKIADPLASQYNGVSVLENHHITTAFRLLEQPGCNFIAGLDMQMQEQFRQLVTRIILSTDMSKHNACRSAFASIVEQMQRIRGDKLTGDGKPCRRSSILAHPLEDPDSRASVLCYIVHCVDIGASTKPWQTLKPWVSRIFTEFFNEGDAEVEMHLQVGELNSRKVDIAQAQKGFITFVVAPLWQLWSLFVTPEQCRVQLENLRFNMEAWSGLSGSSPSSQFVEEYRLPRPHVNSFKREASLSAVVGLYPHGRQPRKVTRQQSM